MVRLTNRVFKLVLTYGEKSAGEITSYMVNIFDDTHKEPVTITLNAINIVHAQNEMKNLASIMSQISKDIDYQTTTDQLI